MFGLALTHNSTTIKQYNYTNTKWQNTSCTTLQQYNKAKWQYTSCTTLQ